MRPIKIALLGLVSSSISAFEITIYNNVGKCDTNVDTLYRVISGVSNGTCYNFDEAMPGTDCVQYKNGSTKGPTSCSSDPFLPVAVIQDNSNAPCTFYSQKSCQGSVVQTNNKCLDGTSAGIATFRSFSCTRDQKVDILGYVACHNAVSTSVCVNDCDCVCNGQVLYCPPNASRCTTAAYRNCKQFCSCTNPCDQENERIHAQNKIQL